MHEKQEVQQRTEGIKQIAILELIHMMTEEFIESFKNGLNNAGKRKINELADGISEIIQSKRQKQKQMKNSEESLLD